MNDIPARQTGKQLALWTPAGGASVGSGGGVKVELKATPQPPRVIHYLGSKLRLLGPIRQAVGELVAPGQRICDLFAGSGAVSVELAGRWDVMSVDIQEYSRVLCSSLTKRPATAHEKARGALQAARTSDLLHDLSLALADTVAYEDAVLRAADDGRPERLCDLLTDGPLVRAAVESDLPTSELTDLKARALESLATARLGSGAKTVVSRHFGGVYFSWKQAIAFDALLEQIHRLDGVWKDFSLSVLLAVASDVVNTIGKQFAQPIRPRDASGNPKHHLMRKTVRDRTLDIFECYSAWIERLIATPTPKGDHSALRRDYRAVLDDPDIEIGAVYADPPYTRDHYSRYYHVLETMARYDEPKVSTTMIRTGGRPRLSRGVYREGRHQSPFCIKSQAPGAFEYLFRAVSGRRVPLVLSYSPYRADSGNRPRLLTVGELISLAEVHFGSVECRFIGGLIHNKMNSAKSNVDVDYDAEVLLLCRP